MACHSFCYICSLLPERIKAAIKALAQATDNPESKYQKAEK
jgi:hypothetical protein